MLFQLTCISLLIQISCLWHMISQPELWHPALSPRQLVPKPGCSPAAPRTRPCAEPSTCPVLLSGEASWSTSCSAEAELSSSSSSLVALRVSYGQRTVWRYTLLCRRTRVHLHNWDYRSCVEGAGKTASAVQTQPGSVLFVFILIYYLTPIFF